MTINDFLIFFNSILIMKKSDFDMFKLSLNLNIEVDNSLRRISEKIKLLNHTRDTKNLSVVSNLLSNLDNQIDEVVSSSCSDE